MLLLEINEFNPELMALAAERLDAKNLQRLLALNKTHTITNDQKERFGLDPWVQWVSIHTGKPSKEHGVEHLGDIPQLEHPQIWEKLSQLGVSSGIWGAMNASKGSASQCDFFFPDPWSFSEAAYPAGLNHLLAFPRYYSKNYCDLDKKQAAKTFMQLIWFCLNPKIALHLLPLAPRLISSVIKHGLPEYLLFVLFDLINIKLFTFYYKKYQPEFSLLFLNSLAHLQHHKWTEENDLSAEMRVAFTLFDEALGILFDSLAFDKPLIATNAFTQYCSYSDNEFLYRQKNPEDFLNTVGITFNKVEQAMTNDGHVFFDNREQAEAAAKILEAAKVNGKPAFHVEHSDKTPEKIFFQVIVWEPLDKETTLAINGHEILFSEQFETITRRSGSHTPNGHIFSEKFDFPEKIYNHEIHDYILQYFQKAAD